MRRRVKRGLGPPPEPVNIPPSGEFVGNDGPWSTHKFRIGTPPQFLKMLVATSSPETWVIDAEGCKTEDTKDCPYDRGQIFEPKNSSTWLDWSNRTSYPLDNDRGIPLGGTGIYGSDVVHITNRQVNADFDMDLPEHIIAQISTKDFFLGMIGISPRPLSTEKQRAGHVSNLVDLKNKNLIPSKSYGYTAGARYRRQGPGSKLAQASLVLGGYEPSLIKKNNVDFKMPPEEAGRDLEVFVKGISYKDSNSTVTHVSNTTFSAIVDSAISHYWLPKPICDAFANAFHLQYNSTLGMYLLNDDDHERMLSMNPEISFTLATQQIGGAEITFPLSYSSFELKLTKEYPDNNIWRRYFPVRPATQPSQHTLGRAFLQEIYLVANYESRNFSLSMRNFESELDNRHPHRIAIPDPTRPVTRDVSNAATYGLIAAGCALAGVLILVMVWRCGKRRSKKDAESQGSTVGKAELDSTGRTFFEMDKGNEVFEMSGKPSRVEAINPELKCPFDDDTEIAAAAGPFELPADDQIETITRVSSEPSSYMSGYAPTTSQHHMDEELISPIEGTIGSGMYTMSTYNNTISPVTPITPIEPPESSLLRHPHPPNPPLEPIKEKT